ncbi:MAG: ABC transporter permease [Spirochaetaceae bacterium]|jgi:ABC-2 type transport system permease protein|nr:ABC transporter permease [Spirochaetaceae bacterium]
MLKYLIEKEFRQLLRNPFLPRLIVMFPLMILLFLPLAANFEIQNINLTVVDNDHSSYSNKLIQKTVSSGYFRLTDVAQDYSTALKSIELDRADILMEIPKGFEETLVREKTADIMLSINAVNGTKGAFGSSYLTGIIMDFSSQVREEWLSVSNQNKTPAFSIIPRYRFNPYLRYPVFMVPALMVMLLTMLCGFLPALNIVGEKEKGTMEQMNVTPVKKFTMILSKLIPYWIIGFIVLTISFAIARIFYKLTPAGNILILYLFSSVFILGISGIGLVISNYARTLQQAMFMMFFFIITFIFMSGLYTPVSSMPNWAQFISNFVPLKYMIEVLRSVYLIGSGFLDLYSQFFALIGFAVFFNGWAVFSYKKVN